MRTAAAPAPERPTVTLVLQWGRGKGDCATVKMFADDKFEVGWVFWGEEGGGSQRVETQ
jgi:hypothetical protein